MTVLHTEVLDGSTADLLSRIGEDKVFRDFYLAGGTGLAPQLGHRMSLDLGLFSERPWSPVFLFNAVRALGPTVMQDVPLLWNVTSRLTVACPMDPPLVVRAVSIVRCAPPAYS